MMKRTREIAKTILFNNNGRSRRKKEQEIGEKESVLPSVEHVRRIIVVVVVLPTRCFCFLATSDFPFELEEKREPRPERASNKKQKNNKTNKE